jgi:hypothetical protein
MHPLILNLCSRHEIGSGFLMRPIDGLTALGTSSDLLPHLAPLMCKDIARNDLYLAHLSDPKTKLLLQRLEQKKPAGDIQDLAWRLKEELTHENRLLPRSAMNRCTCLDYALEKAIEKAIAVFHRKPGGDMQLVSYAGLGYYYSGLPV